MIRTALIGLLLFVCAGQAQAQIYRHSSTYEESVLRGNADLRRGTGSYLESLGRYRYLNEATRRQRTENWANEVRTRWMIQDEYNERQKPANQLDVWEHRLDNAERRQALHRREDQLRVDGVLPQKQDRCIVIRGREYRNHDEWCRTADHYLNQLERQESRLLDDISDLIGERNHLEALAASVWWERLGQVGQERFLASQRTARYFGDPSPRRYKYVDKRLEIDIEAHFSALRSIRDEQERVREIIRTQGNIELKH